MITVAAGSLKRDGHLRVKVRGLVLADQPPVPPSLRGTNPVADFQAIVSCQSIGVGDTATITNVSTTEFPASTAGNSNINATVSPPPALHRPHRVRDLTHRQLVRRDRGLRPAPGGLDRFGLGRGPPSHAARPQASQTLYLLPSSSLTTLRIWQPVDPIALCLLSRTCLTPSLTGLACVYCSRERI